MITVLGNNGSYNYSYDYVITSGTSTASYGNYDETEFKIVAFDADDNDNITAVYADGTACEPTSENKKWTYTNGKTSYTFEILGGNGSYTYIYYEKTSTTVSTSDLTSDQWATVLSCLEDGGNVILDSNLDVYDLANFVTALNASNLTSVNLDSSATAITELTEPLSSPEGIFNNCKKLASIILPDILTTIDMDAFSRCTGLISITIPSSVTDIRERAFQGCSSLTSIIIPNGVTIIREYTFEGCSSLASIEIPSSVTDIREWAFHGCSNLTSVIYGGTESDWAKIEIGEENDYLTSATIAYSTE